MRRARVAVAARGHHPERVPAAPRAGGAAEGAEQRPLRAGTRGLPTDIDGQNPVVFESERENRAAPGSSRAARGHPQPARATGNDPVPSLCQKPGSREKPQV